MDVYAYVRVSTAKQEDEGGPDRQLDAIRAFSDKRGWTVARVFQDAVTGCRDGVDRPGMAELLLEADATGIRTLVCESPDRFARQLVVGEVLTEECVRRGVEVWEAAGQTQITLSDEPSAVLIRQFRMAIAEYEKSQLVAKMRAGRRRKRLLTGRQEGGKAYGLLPGEALVLARILTMHGQGETSDAIARALTADLIPPPTCARRTKTRGLAGGAWHGSTIRAIVSRSRRRWPLALKGFVPKGGFR